MFCSAYKCYLKPVVFFFCVTKSLFKLEKGESGRVMHPTSPNPTPLSAASPAHSEPQGNTLALASFCTGMAFPGKSTKILQLLLKLEDDLQQSRCGLALLTYVNVHCVGPVLSVAIGGTAEVRAGVTDFGVGDLDRSKVKSHYLW